MNTKGLNDWAAENWKLIAGAIGIAAVILVAFGIWNESRKEKERAATNALYDAQKAVRPLAEAKKPAEAEKALSSVIETFPGTRAAYEAAIQAGDLFMDSGAYAEAVKRYEAAADAAKDSFSKVLARYNLGIAKETAGQYQEAVTSYEDALKVSGSDFLKPELLMAQARCYEALNQGQKALTIYQDVQKNFASNSYYSAAAAAFASQLSGKSLQ